MFSFIIEAVREVAGQAVVATQEVAATALGATREVAGQAVVATQEVAATALGATRESGRSAQEVAGQANTYTYCPLAIANFFLSQKDHGINNLKLNKLVYISFGYAWAALEREIFREAIWARKYGPVIPSIYNCFKEYRFADIPTKAFYYEDWSKGEKNYPEICWFDDSLLDLLAKIWRVYGKVSDWDLVIITHKVGAPWDQVYMQGVHERPIPKETIKKYYDDLCSNE